MTVYFEEAFLENVFMDGVLLYLALKAARVRVRPFRLVLAALLGGGEALLFPLFGLPALPAYAVKFFGGLLLTVVAAENVRSGLVVSAAFFALTFCLGGLLVALYSFFGVEYIEGAGYLVEGAPVGLILCAAVCFLLLGTRAIRAFYRRRARGKDLFPCDLTVGERTVRLTGLLDSGNRLSFRGRPVCVVSAVGALALFKNALPVGRMRIFTVSGSRTSPVFVCDRLALGETLREKVYFTVGDVHSREYSLILHTSFQEENNETALTFARMAR